MLDGNAPFDVRKAEKPPQPTVKESTLQIYPAGLSTSYNIPLHTSYQIYVVGLSRSDNILLHTSFPRSKSYHIPLHTSFPRVYQNLTIFHCTHLSSRPIKISQHSTSPILSCTPITISQHGCTTDHSPKSLPRPPTGDEPSRTQKEIRGRTGKSLPSSDQVAKRG